MALRQPASMDECVYFTRRTIGAKGRGVAWVFREKCPKCKKALMGKPRNDDGGVKIRSSEYLCPSCGFTMEKGAYEDTLTCNIEYTCPHCTHNGEIAVPYKRKTFEGVPCVIFECGKCKKKIGISKKMKAPKVGKKKADEPVIDDEDL